MSTLNFVCERLARPVVHFATITPMLARAAMQNLAACSLLLFSSAYGQSQPPSRIATLLDNLQKVKQVGPVALSPDGKTLAMVLAGTLTLEAVVNPGSAQTPSICTKSDKPHVSALTWSPDGQHLGLLATCGESVGVYLLDTPAKPRVHLLAELHGFAEALQYAPDGKHLGLLYVNGASRPSGALAAMKPPSGVIGVEGLEIQRVATIDAATGQLAQITSAKLHVYEFDWSPDSARLAYIAAPPPGENNWWIAKLYTQTAAAGEPLQVLDPVTVEGPLHGLQIAVPRWSPDGSKLAFIGGLMSDQGATGGDIYTMPTEGGSPQRLTSMALAHTSVTWMQWRKPSEACKPPSCPANAWLLVSEIVGGESRIEALDPNTGDDLGPSQQVAATLGDGRLEMSLSMSDTGEIAYAQSSFSLPPEAWMGHLGSPFHAVTHLNAPQQPAWGKSESVEWTSDGFRVQGWLLYPANYDAAQNPGKTYPLVVMVHGGPSSAVTPRWPGAGFGAAPFSAMGYFVLEPNPRGSYGEGEAFTQANRKDFGYGDLRDILAGVDAVEKKLPIDDKRIGLTGWSYGGFMTMFSVSQTTRFKAAVAGAGISNWQSYYGENSIDQWMTPFFGATVYDDPAVYAKSSAINYIKQIKTPTLVVVGDRDGECPAPQSFEFWHALKAEGIDTQLVVYPNEGHGFVDPAHRRDVMERAVSWFDTHMQ